MVTASLLDTECRGSVKISRVFAGEGNHSNSRVFGPDVRLRDCKWHSGVLEAGLCARGWRASCGRACPGGRGKLASVGLWLWRMWFMCLAWISQARVAVVWATCLCSVIAFWQVLLGVSQFYHILSIYVGTDHLALQMQFAKVKGSNIGQYRISKHYFETLTVRSANLSDTDETKRFAAFAIRMRPLANSIFILAIRSWPCALGTS